MVVKNPVYDYRCGATMHFLILHSPSPLRGVNMWEGCENLFAFIEVGQVDRDRQNIFRNRVSQEMAHSVEV